jgi:hypothetical protein
VLRITVSAETSASPAQVLTIAGTDFSARRAKIWENVTTKRLEVHERGPTHVEVTEGGTTIARAFWERSRYDWSEPNSVRQTVLDSNVLEPGSTWVLRAAPRDGGGAVVEMMLERSFRRGVAGRVGSALNHAGGRRLWRFMLGKTLRAVERTARQAGAATPPTQTPASASSSKRFPQGSST